jgi:hypothetical protein
LNLPSAPARLRPAAWAPLLALAALAGLALLPAPAAATELRGSVQVRGGAGGVLGPRAGYVVTLESLAAGTLVARAVTDRLGRFAFAGVAPGGYRLSIGYPTPLRTLTVTVPDAFELELPPIVLPAPP